MTLEEEIRSVAQLRDTYEVASEVLDKAKREYERAQQALWEHMDASGVSSITVDGVQFTRKSTIFGSVADKSAFIEWAEENAPDLVAPAPRKALVNELVRQKIDNGEDLPPGLNFFARQYVSQTKQ